MIISLPSLVPKFSHSPSMILPNLRLHKLHLVGLAWGTCTDKSRACSTPALAYRLKTYRSAGSISATASQQLRCYFISKCSFPESGSSARFLSLSLSNINGSSHSLPSLISSLVELHIRYPRFSSIYPPPPVLLLFGCTPPEGRKRKVQDVYHHPHHYHRFLFPSDSQLSLSSAQLGASHPVPP